MSLAKKAKLSNVEWKDKGSVKVSIGATIELTGHILALIILMTSW